MTHHFNNSRKNGGSRRKRSARRRSAHGGYDGFPVNTYAKGGRSTRRTRR